jgi:Phage capsid family
MAYNSLITNSPGQAYGAPTPETAQALIPLEYANEIISLVPAQSVARKLFRNINMGHSTLQVPVLDVLPNAYWVNNQGIATPGEAGKEGSYKALQETTNMGWKGVMLTAQTLAVDVPIPKVMLADSQFPIWAEVVPQVAAKLGLALDAACIFGYNSPFAAPALVPAAVSAGAVETQGTHSAAEGAIAHDISALFNLVEAESGFNPSGAIASRSLRYAVRNARSTLGTQIPVASGYDINENEWYGIDVDYLAAPGLWPQTPASGLKGTVAEKTSEVTLTTGETTKLAVGDKVTIKEVTGSFTITEIVSSTKFKVNTEFTKAQKEATEGKVEITVVNPVGLVGDFSQVLLGTRQDLEFQVFDTGVITDSEGNVVLNLMQQDAVNLRVTARFGYAVANSVTYYQPEEAKRYPFAVLFG